MNIMRIPNISGVGVTYCYTYSYDDFCLPLAGVSPAGSAASLTADGAAARVIGILPALVFSVSAFVCRIIKPLVSTIFAIVTLLLSVERFPAKTAKMPKYAKEN